ncbi:hypothetical protein CsSME_00037484 [Camellia sinensis var. sinensis]
MVDAVEHNKTNSRTEISISVVAKFGQDTMLDKTPTLPTGVLHHGWESQVGQNTNSSNRSTSSRLGIQSWIKHQLFQPEQIISVGDPKLDKTPTLPTGANHLGWES